MVLLQQLVRLVRECDRAIREKHVFNGATMIPFVMTTFGELGLSLIHISEPTRPY